MDATAPVFDRHQSSVCLIGGGMGWWLNPFIVIWWWQRWDQAAIIAITICAYMGLCVLCHIHRRQLCCLNPNLSAITNSRRGSRRQRVGREGLAGGCCSRGCGQIEKWRSRLPPPPPSPNKPQDVEYSIYILLKQAINVNISLFFSPSLIRSPFFFLSVFRDGVSMRVVLWSVCRKVK